MSEATHLTQQTRASLLAGLQAGADERWQEFFRIYGPLIRRFALKAGCTEVEADDVVQDTAIGVARHLPAYHYEPAKCRFKTWLLNQTAWRVKDQLKKRRRREACIEEGGEVGRQPVDHGDSSPAGAIERAHDPAGDALERLWEAEWQESLLESALVAVKGQFSDRQFQIFDLNVRKEWPAGEVARSLGVNLASVYLAKHRVTAALKREVARLQRLDTLGDGTLPS